MKINLNFIPQFLSSYTECLFFMFFKFILQKYQGDKEGMVVGIAEDKSITLKLYVSSLPTNLDLLIYFLLHVLFIVAFSFSFI